MLPPLAERLAAQLTVQIEQVDEPNRSRLLAWIEKMANGQMVKEPISNWAGFSEANVCHELATWLSEFDALGMIDQYQLLRLLCQDAARFFGKDGRKRDEK